MIDLNPQATAVLVIDVQTGIFEDDPTPLNKERVLKRINQVTAVSRDSGIQVIFVQHDGDPSEDWLTPNTEGWRIHPAVHVEDGVDRIFRKTACDSFYKTELESYLRSKSIDTLLFTGYATDFCVDTTLRTAAGKDFNVIAVQEAHTTKDRPVLKADQIIAHHEWMWANLICAKGVKVVPFTEVIDGLRTAAIDDTLQK